MSKIRKANELDVQVKIKALIFGQPGIGKTTLSLSANNPLLFDCDGGVNRVNYNHIKDTVQVQSYDDVLDVLNGEDLSAYDTLVFDTGGKLLDMMSTYIIARYPKMGRKNGMLTQDGYGQRKAEFQGLLRIIDSKHKDVIFVAHRQTMMDGDVTRYVPLFGGSNYDALATDLDLIGYMEADNTRRTITFDPSSRFDAKNTCNLPGMMEIPTIVDKDGNCMGKNDFLEKSVFSLYRKRLVERSVEGEAYKKVMAEITDAICAIAEPEDADAFVESIDSYAHIGNSKTIAREKFSAKMKELGFTRNKETNKYERAK